MSSRAAGLMRQQRSRFCKARTAIDVKSHREESRTIALHPILFIRQPLATAPGDRARISHSSGAAIQELRCSNNAMKARRTQLQLLNVHHMVSTDFRSMASLPFHQRRRSSPENGAHARTHARARTRTVLRITIKSATQSTTTAAAAAAPGTLVHMGTLRRRRTCAPGGTGKFRCSETAQRCSR